MRGGASWAEVAEGGGDVGWRVVGGGLDFEQHVRLFIDGIALSCNAVSNVERELEKRFFDTAFPCK